MCRSHELERNLVAQALGFTEVHRLEEGEALLCLLHGVQRQCGRVLRCFESVMKCRVFFLQVSGVRKQNSAQFDGGWSGVDRAMEALFYQSRNPAGVVEVCMGQDDGVDFEGMDG